EYITGQVVNVSGGWMLCAARETAMKALTAAEMREVDRLTTECYGIPSLQLMENAGSKAADAVRRTLAGRGDVRACVLCGKGNNGGDGFVVARYLKEAGLPTRVILFSRR